MFELLAVLIIVFFSVWGLGELLHSVKLRFLRPKLREKTIVVAILKEPGAIAQLNHTVARFRWLGPSYADHIVVTGKELTEEATEACRNIAEKNNDISFCDSATLLHMIDSLMIVGS